MKRVLISLISEQTIPNLRIINKFKSIIDHHVFITTKKMEDIHENRAAWIMRAAGLKLNQVSKIIVDPNDLSSIYQKMEEFDFLEENEYYVNVTGGNKLMSIAVMNYFLRFNSKIFYCSTDSKHYMQIHPKDNPEKQKFTLKLSIINYLKAYGLTLIKGEYNLTDNRISNELFAECMKYNNNSKYISRIKKAHQYSSINDRIYYSGGWFEEYIYYKIKKELNLSDRQIAMKTQIANRNTRNEYDVVFIYNNVIHIVECKAYFTRNSIKSRVESGLYKLGALDDDFGIKARSIFITNYDIISYNRRENRTLENRAKDLDVKLYQMKHIKNNSFIKDIIENKL